MSLESDADQVPDEDGTANIIPLTDTPNLDGLDDGPRFPIVLPACSQVQFDYDVTVVRGPATRYANVWFDFNQDGDWADTSTCEDPLLGTVAVPEWTVQNQVIQLAPGQYTLTTPLFQAQHPNLADEQTWMRISVADAEAPAGQQQSPDGRGPSVGYDFGETEDYLLGPEPGKDEYVPVE